MKVTSRYLRNFWPLVAIAWISQSAVAAGPVTEHVGRVARITQKIVTVDHLGDFAIDLTKAQCFDHRSSKMTCATLIAVGYVDKAKITFSGDTVQRIDVLELQQ